jgi:hypothetical protein
LICSKQNVYLFSKSSFREGTSIAKSFEISLETVKVESVLSHMKNTVKVEDAEDF